MATVLTVGSIFNRRHVDHLIRAFARIAARLPGARLVIVGENRTHPHQDLGALIRDLRVTDRVDLRSYVSDDELLALYGQARAFAFLSTYEGFGLTPVEAIISGVPPSSTTPKSRAKRCRDWRISCRPATSMRWRRSSTRC